MLSVCCMCVQFRIQTINSGRLVSLSSEMGFPEIFITMVKGTCGTCTARYCSMAPPPQHPHDEREVNWPTPFRPCVTSCILVRVRTNTTFLHLVQYPRCTMTHNEKRTLWWKEGLFGKQSSATQLHIAFALTLIIPDHQNAYLFLSAR